MGDAFNVTLSEMNASSFRVLVSIVLPAALLIGGCASVPPPHPGSTPRTSQSPSASISPTPSKSALLTTVTLTGARSGVLSGVHSLCSNQFPAVQVWGSLGGNTYNVIVAQPGVAGNYSEVLENLGPESQTSSVSNAWIAANSIGVTNYNRATGATFNIRTTPDSSYYAPGQTPPATYVLYVTGKIVC